ncbi:beta-lactamase-like protein [Trametes polyzona]|nr:beta-lactamase-like protein [Trametes polyzona]
MHKGAGWRCVYGDPTDLLALIHIGHRDGPWCVSAVPPHILRTHACHPSVEAPVLRELPAPAPDQAYCDVFALEGGFIQIPLAWVIDTAKEGETNVLPVLAFLLRHSSTGNRILFDLGIRKDIENLPTPYHDRINSDTLGFRTTVPADVADSLAKEPGGLAPADITHVCYSHLHYDHIGDSRPYTNATFIVGGAARPLVEHGWPKDPHSLFPQDLLPPGRTRWLDDYVGWPPLGPFPHALDLYGDGSIYVVDAPGHMPGHVNLLARTSADGAWIFLAGDSAHDWRLLTGEARIASHALLGCAHGDKTAAAAHIARMRALEGGGCYARVRVLLAHDVCSTAACEERARGSALSARQRGGR